MNKLENDLFDATLTDSLIIDPIAAGFGRGIQQHNLMALINDCRKDIDKSTIPTKDDAKVQNVGFITANVNGWPSAFVVTIKNIKKKEPLWCDYGSAYPVAMAQHKDDRKIQKENQIIADNIIGDQPMQSKNGRELYQLC